MAHCIDAVQDAMTAVSSNRVSNPPRVFTGVNNSGGQLGLMPGAVEGLPVYGTKILSLQPGNQQKGYPSIQGAVLLFDRDDGAPVALIDGISITAIRTAAASGFASKLLAREDAKTHGIFGTGVQARYHAEAIACARSSITQTVIWGRDKQKAQSLVDDLSSKLTGQFSLADAPEQAAQCDIVSTVTASATPILKGQWLQAGAHLNLVGSHEPHKREADTEAIICSSVYVDHLQGALSEAGDLLIPMSEGRFAKKDIVGEIGALALSQIKGRHAKSDITLYKSLGLFAQDLCAAWAVLKAADAAGIAETVSF